MTLDELPPLRDVVASHGLSARKRFGQHFLFDLNITAKIARAAGPLEGCAVVEIGPGPGGLTRALLNAGAARVIAVEADTRFLPALEEISDAADRRLIIVQDDARRLDEPALLALHAPGLPAHIVANLPYNVATPLLVRWLTAERWWSSMTLMFQKEVAERIASPASTPAYGRLSVLCQLRARPTLTFDVPARAFTPPPKVDSAVVRFDALEDGGLGDIAALEQITAAAFGQRRKMLRSSLKGVAAQAGLPVERLLADVGVSPEARPETVTPHQFAEMASAWRRAQGGG